MNDFRVRSRDRLEAECTKLIKDLYVSCLDRAEKILNPNRKSSEWKQFRFEILNLGNDKLRQMGDKFDDYAIEFRPQILFSVKYIEEKHREAVDDKLSHFDFSFIKGQPNLRITLPNNTTNENALDDIWTSVRCGCKFFSKDNKLVTLEIYGLTEVFSYVIPFFDNNQCFKGKTLEKYNAWKEKVYELESQGAGNVK